MTEELERLIEVAKRLTPTPEHREAQRRSFAYGKQPSRTRGSPARWLTSRLRSWPPMTNGKREARESRAAEPELITDPQLKAEAEAANGLRRYRAVKSVQEALERQPFKLRVSRILAFQREALQGISGFAGLTRPAGVEIRGSKHEPPGAHLVQELLEELLTMSMSIGRRRRSTWRPNEWGGNGSIRSWTGMAARRGSFRSTSCR